MAKVRVVRYSGRPVDELSFKAFENEYVQEYDKIAEACGQDMLEFHKQLQTLDAKLEQKYANIMTEELPKTAKAWRELTLKYDAPIMLARSSDNPKELIMVVMDQALA